MRAARAPTHPVLLGCAQEPPPTQPKPSASGGVAHVTSKGKVSNTMAPIGQERAVILQDAPL